MKRTRFTRKLPCPVCGGCESDQRGEDKRCYGYLDSTGTYAHCTRDEFAGSLSLDRQSDEGGSWVHYLEGPCHCGQTHGDWVAPPSNGRRSNGSKPDAGEGRLEYDDGEEYYRYVAADGTPLFDVVRFAGKQFRQYRLNKSCFPIAGLNGTLRVPFHLPALIEAVKQSKPIWIAEGERDVLALEGAGEVATCNPGGTGGGWRDEYSEHLQGADVTIVADNDAKGHEHAAKVAKSVGECAKSVRTVLPAEGKDARDHLEAGRGIEEFVPFQHQEQSGADVLEEVAAYFRSYAVMSRAQLVAVTLWAAHTHAMEKADTTPYLHVTSAVKQSGKTRVLEAAEWVVHQPMRAVDVTAAALFRSIEARQPTLLLDEVDTLFDTTAKLPEGQEALRGVLNAGYRRGATVPRVVGSGSSMTVKEFRTFSPKALTGIGNLPDTLADRSIRIRLERAKDDERQTIERFRFKVVKERAKPIQERLAEWIEGLDGLEDARPEVPEELNDRLQDAWEPLLAIADAAGGTWPEEARHSACELAAAAVSANETPEIRLLRDIRSIFEETGGDRLDSAKLVAELRSIDDAPWSKWELDMNSLAFRLRKFRVKPKTIRFGEKRTDKGYKKVWFVDAWERYLDAEGPEEPDEEEQQQVFDDPM